MFVERLHLCSLYLHAKFVVIIIYNFRLRNVISKLILTKCLPNTMMNRNKQKQFPRSDQSGITIIL